MNHFTELVASSVDFVRQNMSFLWNKDNRQTPYRSFLRKASKFFPDKSVKLLSVKQSQGERSWCLTSSNDFVWVNENLGSSCIHIRRENTSNFSSAEILEKVEDGLFILKHKGKTSTPVKSPACAAANPSVAHEIAASKRIAELENELARLQQQVAFIIIAQEQQYAQAPSPIKPVFFFLPSLPQTTPSSDGNELLATNEMSLINVPSTVPPPPPPPPPPPIPPKMKLYGKKDSAFSEPVSSDGFKSPKCRPSMTEVLKDLGKVKLRSVERSPGGTPVRRQPATNPHDPASIIVEALKKKFANKLTSPMKNKENNDFDVSPTKKDSFETPIFGPHLLRKIGK